MRMTSATVRDTIADLSKRMRRPDGPAREPHRVARVKAALQVHRRRSGCGDLRRIDPLNARAADGAGVAPPADASHRSPVDTGQLAESAQYAPRSFSARRQAGQRAAANWR